MSELASRLKTSLDELRMQVLGAQVLLGFQFQSLFQPSFEDAGLKTRAVTALGLIAVCLSLAGLISPAAHHRLVERGDASGRILRLAKRCAEVSLGLLALALGSDVYVGASLQGSSHAVGFACAAMLLSIGMWFGVGSFWKEIKAQQERPVDTREQVDIHTRIEQMLTESRVILPGAQAMLGFQLIVTMTKPFNDMAALVKYTHFAALGMMILAVVLLISPAAVHRLSFEGRDDPRFHRIGSRLIAAALVPLALGIALDFFVATWRLSMSSGTAIVAGTGIFAALIGVWYVWPLIIRSARTSADAT